MTILQEKTSVPFWFLRNFLLNNIINGFLGKVFTSSPFENEHFLAMILKLPLLSIVGFPPISLFFRIDVDPDLKAWKCFYQVWITQFHKYIVKLSNMEH